MKILSVKNTRIKRERYTNADGTAVDRWLVRLGRRFTGAKPIKKRFADYPAAKAWLLEEVAKKQAQGNAGFTLSAGQTEQAERAFTLLAGRATLTDAVENYVKRMFPAAGVKTVAGVVDAWIAQKRKQGRSKAYLDTVSDIFNATAKAFPCNINEVEKAELEKFLATKKKKDGQLISNNSFNHYARDLKALFNFAIEERWAAHNPALAIKLRTETKPDVGVVTPAQALNILHAARNEPGFPALAFFVLALFAGIRTAELHRLSWNDVILDDDEPRVNVPGTKAKDAEARVIDLPANAVEWLKLIPFKNGPIGRPNARRMARIRRAVGGGWSSNAARHSFVSYRARLNGETAASEDAGHESLRITRKRYKRIVSRRAARAYFSITPTTTHEQLAAMLAPAPQFQAVPA